MSKLDLFKKRTSPAAPPTGELLRQLVARWSDEQIIANWPLVDREELRRLRGAC
jgi:hypothetical protein